MYFCRDGIFKIHILWSYWPPTAQVLSLKSLDHFNQLWQVQGLVVACDSLEVSDVVSGDTTQLQRTLPALIALSFTISFSLNTCPFLLPLTILRSLSVCLLSVTLHPSINAHSDEVSLLFLLPVFKEVWEVLMWAYFHTYCRRPINWLTVCTCI